MWQQPTRPCATSNPAWPYASLAITIDKHCRHRESPYRPLSSAPVISPSFPLNPGLDFSPLISTLSPFFNGVSCAVYTHAREPVRACEHACGVRLWVRLSKPLLHARVRRAAQRCTVRCCTVRCCTVRCCTVRCCSRSARFHHV